MVASVKIPPVYKETHPCSYERKITKKKVYAFSLLLTDNRRKESVQRAHFPGSPEGRQ